MIAGFAEIHAPPITKSAEELTEGEKLGLYILVGGEIDIGSETKPDGAYHIKITSRVPFAVHKRDGRFIVAIAPPR